MTERSTAEIVSCLRQHIHTHCNHHPCVLRRDAADRLVELEAEIERLNVVVNELMEL